MKALNSAEIKGICNFLNEQLRGSLLQSVQLSEKSISMAFFDQSRKLNWLFFLLDKNFPFIWIYSSHRNLGVKLKKPLSLFIEKHLLNQKVTQVAFLEKWGRVLEIQFEDPSSRIEIRLIPKQINMGAQSMGKSVWLDKPLVLNESDYQPEQIRSLSEIQKQWESFLSKDEKLESNLRIDQQTDQRTIQDLQIKKNLEKKKKALELVQQQIDDDSYVRWQSLGEQLKLINEYSQLDHELKNELNQKLSVRENREICFQKAKQLKTKKEGAKQRLLQLQTEIRKLEEGVLPEIKPRQQNERTPVGVKQRKITLESGLIATYGKSAADNLNLLRKAKPWDYWMHLRDYPGAHVIIQRNKNQNVTQDELKKIAQWLIKETVQIKNFSYLDIILTECRFVSPIKGDKLGRVNYHSEKNLRIHFAST